MVCPVTCLSICQYRHTHKVILFYETYRFLETSRSIWWEDKELRNLGCEDLYLCLLQQVNTEFHRRYRVLDTLLDL
jgi:hypothetical protein